MTAWPPPWKEIAERRISRDLVATAPSWKCEAGRSAAASFLGVSEVARWRRYRRRALLSPPRECRDCPSRPPAVSPEQRVGAEDDASPLQLPCRPRTVVHAGLGRRQRERREGEAGGTLMPATTQSDGQVPAVARNRRERARCCCARPVKRHASPRQARACSAPVASPAARGRLLSRSGGRRAATSAASRSVRALRKWWQVARRCAVMRREPAITSQARPRPSPIAEHRRRVCRRPNATT